MLELAATMPGRPALISASDQFVTAIGAHADVLRDYYILSPGRHLQGLLADKQTQHDLAAKHGMPMPRTEYATCEEQVVRFAKDARFPCLLKPTHFRQWERFPSGHRFVSEGCDRARPRAARRTVSLGRGGQPAP
jgi:predicted ATP-grasp superfamily ATP-dependent carboligase